MSEQDTRATQPQEDSGAPPDVPKRIDIARLMDVGVEVTVELGRKQMRIADILSWGPGSTLEFSKSTDEPLDIRINGKLVARGEAVVLGDRYGVRVTEIVDPDTLASHSG